MSRSNPTEHISHPCTRWFEWDGSNGEVRFYDKDSKKNIIIGSKFQFMVLDKLSIIKGWHDASESGITSNEVRDTKSERLVVKAFKGGILAEGFYTNIRDRIKALGGYYTTNLYIAYKGANGMMLGSIQFAGAALNAWVDFEKENRDAIWKKAIKIDGYVEGKKGKITFRVPKLSAVEITQQSDVEAQTLDKLLQVFLKSYFGRTRVDQIAKPSVDGEPESPIDEETAAALARGTNPEPEPERDDVPF